MSTTLAVSGSASADYAAQLAQTSSLQRTLFNLNTAIQNGNLGAAGSNLAALMKAYPQYASAAGDSSSDQDPVNQDFQTLAAAIDANDIDGAKSAWSKAKSDLANDGLSAIQNPAETTALVLAENQASMDQALITNLLGAGSSPDSSLATLLGDGSGGAADSSNSVSALVSNWLAYEADGSASSAAPASLTGSQLNASA
jgi:hypothetical protein